MNKGCLRGHYYFNTFLEFNTLSGGFLLWWSHASYPTLLLSFCQDLSTRANMFPINKRISVIWKHTTRAISHAPPPAFPIMPGYRKLGCVDNRWLSTGGSADVLSEIGANPNASPCPSSTVPGAPCPASCPTRHNGVSPPGGQARSAQAVAQRLRTFRKSR
jgi:hypothetical protein